ncbi:SO_0444 family Cu/Zn efflux transporter [Aestuariibacter sp. A3R04]|uniref:SO_0444 family Cu/Zn efflux transporter n=1 Tax=Aestuariibacter sp. A3R04 TaxID=2841571 RepID=UPI001C09D9F3|nr:SO_0444 family Cu/Zn efflux transporter [Aestuariibacter sp. A3R04]MBU3020852.1 SO_0444 family Cu/Zn efflux transporter [Aestuariibacter sp. A3R04]
MTDITIFITNFLALFVESAPWLLLGLLVAGIMHELVPISLLQKHMGKSSVGAVIKAAFIGAPLPLCSCGVIPAALGLRRSGASRPATVSFLVSTPETGVDSVSVSYALLGPVFAIIRPLAAVISAIYAGIMVKFFAEKDRPLHKIQSCRSKKVAHNKDNEHSAHHHEHRGTDSCCETTNTSKGRPGKFASLLQFSTGKLLEDITLWLLVGLLLAAAIQTWVPTSFLTSWGDGFLAMLVMALIGVPMYICATASTPLAVGFLSAGLSPGAILVFLLAGPATNVSTMGMIGKEMGKRTLAIYIFCILSSSIGLGYLLNLITDAYGLGRFIPTGEGHHIHGGGVEMVYALCAVLLGALIARNTWQNGMKKWARAKTTKKANNNSCCH